MKPKRTIIPTLSLGQNFRLIMTREGVTFRELSRKAKVSVSTIYKLPDRRSFLVTDQLIRCGRALGFTRKQVEEKMQRDRLASRRTYSKREKLYQLVSELIDLFN